MKKVTELFTFLFTVRIEWLKFNRLILIEPKRYFKKQKYKVVIGKCTFLLYTSAATLQVNP